MTLPIAFLLSYFFVFKEDEMPGKMNSKVEADRILVLERVFDAPRGLVFKMFKEADQLKHWWGPRGWEVPVCKVDFREGGTWHYCMKCADKSQGEFYGMEAWGKAVYGPISEPESIVYRDYFSDANGGDNKDLPSALVTTKFIEMDGGKTKIVSSSEYAKAEELKTVMDMGVLPGITETWDRLEERLASLS